MSQYLIYSTRGHFSMVNDVSAEMALEQAYVIFRNHPEMDEDCQLQCIAVSKETAPLSSLIGMHQKEVLSRIHDFELDHSPLYVSHSQVLSIILDLGIKSYLEQRYWLRDSSTKPQTD